jgi:hypothetical protein
MWGMECIPHSAFSQIEKDDDLIEMIRVSKFGYAKPFRLAWNAYNKNSKSTKGKKEKEMQVMCKYYELKMIHGW